MPYNQMPFFLILPFKKNGIINIELTNIARTLFNKHIAFCLYRFPGERAYRLAVEEKYLTSRRAAFFTMVPFVETSTATALRLAIVNNSELDDVALVAGSLPDQNIQWYPLPAETTRDEYFTRIAYFLNELRNGSMDKVVLSRVILVDKPAAFDPFNCFENLSLAYPETFTYLLYHPVSGMWSAASPELLLQNSGGVFETMALGGTQPKNESHGYQWRDKEMEEHAMVVRHIESVLGSGGAKIVEKKGPITIETGRVAHLQTNFSFTLDNTRNMQDLVDALHPTPAVAGLPVQPSVDLLKEHEGYDRRYYCGYLGETDWQRQARLFINLRCMQIGQHNIAIYCGGGITAASDAAEEWNETEQKSLTLLNKIVPAVNLHKEA